MHGHECAERNPRSPISIDDAPSLFEEDFRRSFESSYYVLYDLEVEFDGRGGECSVAWWKDGTDRQRFDMCAPLVYGDDFEGEPWRILMFGDRDQILVCSSRLPIEPTGELDEGETGACHEDSTGIGDLAGNAVYFLNFPLEYPDALPSTYFDGLDEVTFEDAWTETIAGLSSRCYVISVDDEPDTRTEVCYAENGAPVKQSGSEFVEFELRAKQIGPVSDDDFERPYPYVDASLD
jgi:hypothetical protein